MKEIRSSTYRYPCNHRPYQGRNFDMAGKPPSRREASTHNYPCQVVVGKREARAEKKEARVAKQ